MEGTRSYSIVVRGRLGNRLDGMFGGLQIRSRSGETELVGPVIDQAELFGLLTCLRDLGIDLVSVNPVRARADGFEER
ncbi:MAG: hypothetical protein ACJ75G_07735 [Gaiellaceae bacterium]